MLFKFHEQLVILLTIALSKLADEILRTLTGISLTNRYDSPAHLASSSAMLLYSNINSRCPVVCHVSGPDSAICMSLCESHCGWFLGTWAAISSY